LATAGAAFVGAQVLSSPGTNAGAGSRESATGTSEVAIVARGSSNGYDATVQVLPVQLGDGRAIRFDVQLTTEATPASAPHAEAKLRGPGGEYPVALEIIGPGRWNSQPLAVTGGKYTLTSRFERKGNPVVISVQFQLP
jgi:hypothetical protein